MLRCFNQNIDVQLYFIFIPPIGTKGNHNEGLQHYRNCSVNAVDFSDACKQLIKYGIGTGIFSI